MDRNHYPGCEVGAKRCCLYFAAEKCLGKAFETEARNKKRQRSRFPLLVWILVIYFLILFKQFFKDYSVWKKTNKLKRFLSEKLAEFLDSKFIYRLRRITSLEKKQIYIGPIDNSDEETQSGDTSVR